MSNGGYRREFDKFYRQNKKLLEGYLRRSLGVAPDVVDDVVNPAFAVAWRHWARVRTSNPKAYLFTVARNAVRKPAKGGYSPQHWISLDAITTDTTDFHHEVECPADSLVMQAEVKNLLDCLPPRQRETLILRYIAGFSVKQTAEIMKVTQGTVKSGQSEALRKLRAVVRHLDDHDGSAKEVREQ